MKSDAGAEVVTRGQEHARLLDILARAALACGVALFALGLFVAVESDSDRAAVIGRAFQFLFGFSALWALLEAAAISLRLLVLRARATARLIAVPAESSSRP